MDAKADVNNAELSEKQAEEQLKADKAKEALFKEAVDRGYKLTGTQECPNIEKEIEKAIETIDPLHALKAEGKDPAEIKEALKEQQEFQEEFADDLPNRSEIRIERGKKLALIFKALPAGNNWRLANEKYITSQHSLDLAPIDIVCPHRKDGSKFCTFDAVKGMPPDPNARDVTVPMVWVQDSQVNPG